MLAGLLIGFGVSARPQSEVGKQKFESCFEGGSLRKRSEIDGVIRLFDAGELQSGELFVHIYLEHEITLVVSHEDIVVRRKILDEP